MESEKYLTAQLITYLGNKRKLLNFIGTGLELVMKRLGKNKLEILDGFAGSGIVSRWLKQYSSKLYSNDLETYAYIIGMAYLQNRSDINPSYLSEIIQDINNKKYRDDYSIGIIEQLYAPKDDENILQHERVFYTNQNAKIIDNIRRTINEYNYDKNLLIAPLLSEASIHANTSGVFKGFYKNSITKTGQFGGNAQNCLSRIKAEIYLPSPIFSEYECEWKMCQEDTNKLIDMLPEIDVAYYDPPYNEHPYGSNYFMLNVISKYEMPNDLSKVSGIPNNWNRSAYNNSGAKQKMHELLKNTRAKYILLSYNNEGIIPFNELQDICNECGRLQVLVQDYSTFKGSRNLNDRNPKTKEFLFILEK